MDPQEELRKELLVFATVDWVELQLFPSLVEELLELHDPEAVREKSLQLVRDFLERGLMEAGTVNWEEGRFEPWPLPAEESFARIKKEWLDLGRRPRMSDICWFDITPAGSALVKQWKEKGGLPVQVQGSSQLLRELP